MSVPALAAAKTVANPIKLFIPFRAGASAAFLLPWAYNSFAFAMSAPAASLATSNCFIVKVLSIYMIRMFPLAL